MARNKLAGKSTGKSKSAKYYAANPDKRAAKQSYDSKFQKSKSQVKKRTALNKANRDDPNSKKGDGKDMSHTKSGLKLKPQSKNRGSKSDAPGDKRARGGKKGKKK